MFKNILIFLVFLSRAWAVEPSILYLSWKGDPSTTMTVLWHSEVECGPKGVYYKRSNSEQWEHKVGSGQQILGSNVTVHHAELTGLEPDTLYHFRFEGGKTHSFCTLPRGLSRPLNVVIGGDAYFSKELNTKMNREVASRSPDFVILAGDLAYTEGLRCALRSRLWKIRRWQEFFQMWSEDMVTKEGRLIPIMPVIGNHDVQEGFDHPLKKGTLFYQFFVFEEAGIPFRTMKIGEDLVFYLLDSGHTFPIAGRQREWLEEALEEGMAARYRIPVYHIPAYPSKTNYTHKAAVDIRKHWVPLFERYGVRVSMEHDCHTFKRTFPLRNGLVDSEGIHYLGDGAWGVFAEKPARRWYLKKATQTNNYWQLIIDAEKIDLSARNHMGALIDCFQVGASSGAQVVDFK